MDNNGTAVLEHNDACSCGHDHHDHEQGDVCGCGHDHGLEEHAHDVIASKQQAPKVGRGRESKRVYRMQNLGCAHCASQMEQKISAMSGVSDCVLVYETKQLRITAKNADALLPEMQKACAAIEHDVKIIPREEAHAHSDGNSKKPIIAILAGAALFALSFLPAIDGILKTVILLVSYVILGWHVLYNAVRNITRGQVFDENFLMSIATIGAAIMGDYAEAVGVMLFYSVGEFCEDLAVDKSRRQIIEAVDQRPEIVTLVEGDRTIPAGEAQIGDVLLVRPGDRIPLDGMIVKGESRLDTSAITGEPVPVHVGEGESVLSGCLNTEGVLHLQATHTLGDSMVTRILDSVENAAAQKPKLNRFITRFAKIYTPAVVLVALLTAVIPGLITGAWSVWVYKALTFLVISCPCALVLSVPLTFFAGIGAGSKRGILFKGGVSLEALREMNTVVMDKTGTITQGNFVVQEVCPVNGAADGQILALANACEGASTHPIAISIRELAKTRAVRANRAENVREQAGEGISATIEGTSVLCGNTKLMQRHGVDLTQFRGVQGSTEVLIAVDGNFLGHIRIADTIKADAVEAIAKLRKLGVKTVMLTGDNKQGAEAVAQMVGIDEVHAQLMPDEKLSMMQQLRRQSGSGVMFVGDGINDAPVLAGADVGAAMGSGADAAIEAADVVFMTSELSAVPISIEIARRVNRIAVQNIVFALAFKIAVMFWSFFSDVPMFFAVFADSGVALLCVLNAIRLLRKDRKA